MGFLLRDVVAIIAFRRGRSYPSEFAKPTDAANEDRAQVFPSLMAARHASSAIRPLVDLQPDDSAL
jgi:hypothetical protein